MDLPKGVSEPDCPPAMSHLKLMSHLQSKELRDLRDSLNLFPSMFLASHGIGDIRKRSNVNGEFRLEWDIDEGFSRREVEHYILYSPVFHFFGLSCNLICMYSRTPNDFRVTRNSERSGWMEMFIYKEKLDVDNRDPIFVHFKLGMKLPDDTDEFRVGGRISPNEHSGGSCKFMSISDLLRRRSRLPLERPLTFICLLKRKIPTALRSVGNVRLDHKKLLLSGEGNDVTLRVKGREFRVHWNILKARSTVFGNMFRDEMESDKPTGVVDIDDCNPDRFQDFLHYVYTGQRAELSAMNVYSFYSAANKFQMYILMRDCLEHMKRNLSVETFYDVMGLAVRFDEYELRMLSSEFFGKYMKDNISTTIWQNLGNITRERAAAF